MISQNSPQDIIAGKALRAFCIVNSVVAPLLALVWMNYSLQPMWYWAAAWVIVWSTTAYVLFVEKSKIKNFAIYYLFISLPIIFASGITTHIISQQNPDSVPFFGGIKVLALVIAAIAPIPTWVGYFMISFCLFLPPLQVLIFSPDIMIITNNSEPWVAMIYSIIGFVLLMYRLASQKTQADLIESRANEQSLKDFAEVAIAMRDLTNTPLQSLTLLAELLKNNQITTKQASDLLLKTTYKLHELSHLLNEKQKNIDMNRNQGSLNSMEVLRKRFGSLPVSRESV